MTGIGAALVSARNDLLIRSMAMKG
jgi:hypothetical protein